jgi:magnesium-transporting ATPase (P-type)
MAASENLAYTNTICTGKTGTLTSGVMAVREVFIGGTTERFDI